MKFADKIDRFVSQMVKKDILEFYRRTAQQRERWNRRNRYYHRLLEKYCSFIIPQGKRVLEIGCSSGDLLNAVKPSYGVGIDFVAEVIEIAKLKYNSLHFDTDDIENTRLSETFDYIIISDTLGSLWDAQAAMRNVRRLCHAQTRIVISQYSFLWEPAIKILECLGLKQKLPNANWFSNKDVVNLLELEDFQVIKTERKILFPLNIPFLSVFLNRFIGNLPALNRLCLVNLTVARLVPKADIQASVSIIVPARNERGNI
ncbi:MAG: class I SAM-dependent methyltransferase [Prevotellaceae bacterium]|jgi:SAM-dependent methyltransferase|nr:class I SAM-dependent methyltransferase [Prevotellaceae bacterium]